uniref:Uncharacterized protein n=1 Tax=Anopheles epiroticus TaxID=199890 RepID=A0A9I3FH45_9DIPT
MASVMRYSSEVIFIFGSLLWLSQFRYAENVYNYEDQKNITRPFKIHVHRMLCIETPYKESILLECRLIFRRNQRSLLYVSLTVPRAYNYVLIQFRLHYKFTTYKTFLIDGQTEGCAYMRNQKNDPILSYMYGVLKDLLPSVVQPCPYGNTTYSEMFELKEEHAPLSVPAGEYRMDIRFSTRANVTIFSLQLFFAIRRKGIFGSMLEW